MKKLTQVNSLLTTAPCTSGFQQISKFPNRSVFDRISNITEFSPICWIPATMSRLSCCNFVIFVTSENAQVVIFRFIHGRVQTRRTRNFKLSDFGNSEIWYGTAKWFFDPYELSKVEFRVRDKYWRHSFLTRTWTSNRSQIEGDIFRYFETSHSTKITDALVSILRKWTVTFRTRGISWMNFWPDFLHAVDRFIGRFIHFT